MLPNLDRILANANLTLSLFEERYGGGYTALLAPILDHASWVEDQLTGEDNAAVEIQVFLGSDAGKRFPVGHGATPTLALQELDGVLGLVSTDISQWRDAVQTLYDAMLDAERKYRGPWFIGNAKDAGELPPVE